MARPGYDEVTLLTGYPSFLARKLSERILSEEPKTLLYAVVRTKLAAEAVKTWQALPQGARERLVLIDGDATAMDLGLSGKEFRTLAAEVDRIHHAAKITYLGVDETTAEQVNVVGTREVLELARAAPHLRAVVVHSSTSVFGDKTGIAREDDLEVGQRFRSGVERTRFQAERIVRNAMAKLPIVVLRPSIIIGDSTSGEIDRFDGPYLLILLIVTSPAEIAIPLPGRGDVPLHLVPIDYVVRAAHAIGRDPRAPGHTFHLVDTHPLSAVKVFDLVARVGGRPSPRGFIPTNLTKALLRTPGLERFVKSPRAFVQQLATPIRFDARHTEEILAGSGITCPPFESYAGAIVDYVREQIQEKRARRAARRAAAAAKNAADREDPPSPPDPTPSAPGDAEQSSERR